MTNLLALITIIVWPVIPLFWIPLHFTTNFFRKLGIFTYAFPLITWLPIAYIIYRNRTLILQERLLFPFVINISGIMLLISGFLLHIWTGWLLKLWGLIGLPEVFVKQKGKLVTHEAFSVVRHPTYLAHTLIFLGVFLYTEVLIIGIITLLDILVINIVIIPLEEKELLNRFGDKYIQYKNKVPRFFPRIYKGRRGYGKTQNH